LLSLVKTTLQKAHFNAGNHWVTAEALPNFSFLLSLVKTTLQKAHFNAGNHWVTAEALPNFSFLLSLLKQHYRKPILTLVTIGSPRKRCPIFHFC
jgi:hypothetical protein